MIGFEQKKELIKLINAKNYKEIEKFAKKHINNFDRQTWEILAYAELIKANYSKDFFSSLKSHYEKSRKIGLLNNMSLLSSLRLECALIDTEALDENT